MTAYVLVAALCLVAPLLWVHALRTHGAWYSAIWIGLTGAFGIALEVAAAPRLGPVDWAEVGPAVAGVPLFVGLAWCTVIYLGALLSKGFVERSRWRGAVLPFVLVHGMCSLLVALPWEVLAPASGGWQPGAPAGASTRIGVAMLKWGVGAALFGGAYRLVTRRTTDDRVKFLLLALLPLLLAALSGAIRAS